MARQITTGHSVTELENRVAVLERRVDVLTETTRFLITALEERRPDDPHAADAADTKAAVPS